MTTPGPLPAAGRTALIAGATGLVGRALLTQMLASGAYDHVHVLARRALPELSPDARITQHLVDFARLSSLHSPSPVPAVDDVFIALGTTLKVAGSQAAFRAVDFDAVVDTARAARAAGARRVAVVSSLGANARSSVFYNRVKGEMQAAVGALGFESVVFAQPSLLLGDRAALGQPGHAAESFAIRALAPLMRLVPRAVRPIEAVKVAASLLAATLGATPGATLGATPGVRVIASGQMQG